MTVDIIDPCSHSKIDLPSNFAATYDEASQKIEVKWTEFKVKPKDEVNCPPVPLSFSVSSSGDDPKYEVDLEKR